MVDVTFGESAAAVNDWAKTMIEKIGMSETAAKKYSGAMGAMLKSMGFTTDEAYTMSTSLVQLAGDMSSFYNLDHETAYNKIRAGLSGETEPLKALGINMSTANLEAYALQQGINKTWNEMSASEQTMLRYQYLLEVTADAQGDFARTSDGYANGVRMLQENFNSLKTTIGQALLPAISSAVSMLNTFITDLTSEHRSIQQIIDDTEAAYQKEVAAAEMNAAEAERLLALYDKYAEEMEDGADNTELMKRTVEDLTKVYPDLTKYVDIETGLLKTNTAEIRNNIAAMKDQALVKAGQAKLQELSAAQLEAYNTQWDAKYKLDNYLDQVDKTLTDADKAFIDRNREKFALIAGYEAEHYANATYADILSNAKIQNYLADQIGKDTVDSYTGTDATEQQADAGMQGLSKLGVTAVASNIHKLNSELYNANVAYDSAVAATNEWSERLVQFGGTAEQTEIQLYTIAGTTGFVSQQTEEATDASDKYTKSIKNEADALKQMQSSLQKIIDYENQLYKTTKKSLDGVCGEFDHMDEVTSANLGRLTHNLQTQLAYWQDYDKYLDAVLTNYEEYLTPDMIAYLSSGSTDAMSILQAVNEATNKGNSNDVLTFFATWKDVESTT